MLELLIARDGIETTVVLHDGRRLAVLDVAWGYDAGDEFSHITSNCSPGRDGWPMDVFSSSDVQSIVEPTEGVTLLVRGR